jgi:hypothetical protein
VFPDSDVIAAINGVYNVNITYEDDVHPAPSKGIFKYTLKVLQHQEIPKVRHICW